jgi:hypothetical protein
MQYLIAGGGEFGTRYLRKLHIAHKRSDFPIESITVFDNDPNCKAREFVDKISYAHLEVTDLLQFGEMIWKRQEEWMDATWIPAPVAPHLIANWIKTKIESEQAVQLVPALLPLNNTKLPFFKLLPDGRFLLSHAPGICPVNCTEPANCAITNGPRWWEMKDTIKNMLAELPEEEAVTYVALLYGEHHYGADKYGVGGIAMKTIYSECDKLSELVREGKRRVGIATISSCHGVLSLFDVKDRQLASFHEATTPEPARSISLVTIQRADS